MSAPTDVLPGPGEPAVARVRRHRHGTLVVLGAPGTGKTTALVGHVQHRILEGGVDPDSCLVLAPTRQSAARLRAQVGAGLGKTFAEPLARTPSSLAFAVLRLAAAATGAPLPRLLSGAEQDVVLRELLVGHASAERPGVVPHWPVHLAAALPTAGFRAQLRDLLMRAVEHGLEPGDLRRLAAEHDRPEWAAAADVLREYDEVTALSEPGAYDPAWICTAAADILEDDPALLERVQERLRLLAIDDAQELTASAARLVRVVHPPSASALLAGDPDASVLGFRGAVPDLFLELGASLHAATTSMTTAITTATRETGPEVVVLGDRHRGGTALAEAAMRVASRIGARTDGSHRAALPAAELPGDKPPGDGTGTDGSVEVAVARSQAQEAAHVARWLRAAHLREGVPWGEMAVIARSGSQQESLRRALSTGGVPVRPDRSGLPLGQDPAVAPLLLCFDIVTRGSDETSEADAASDHDEAADHDDADRDDTEGDWTVTAEEAVALVTSPLGGLDPVRLRRLRRRLRSGELAAQGRRSADEVLAAVLSDPALRRTAASDLDPDLLPVVRVGRVLDAGRAALVGEPAGTAEEVLWALWSAGELAPGWAEQALAGGALGARADRDLDAVLVLFGAAAAYVERLPGSRPRSFLDHVRSAEVAADTLVEGARTGASVEVLTPQAGAGRQWRRVAVVGVQDGVWPDLRLRDTLLGSQALVAALRGQPVSGPEAVRAAQAQVRSDELRQFYVAMTRAAERLLVTAVASTEDQPSGLLALVDPGYESRPAIEVEPALTLRGLTGALRREVVAAQREGDLARRDAAVETLLLLAEAEVPGASPDRWWDAREVSAQRALIPEGEVRVSPSRVQSFLECPLRWFLTSRGAESGDATRAEIGTLVHAVVADDPEGPRERLTAELERRWPELGLRPGWVADRSLREAHEMISRYTQYVAESRQAGRRLVGTELDVSVVLHPGEGESELRAAHLRGSVDRLEVDQAGDLVVVDLKTSRSKPPAAEIARHPQLGAYQVAVEQGAFEERVPRARSAGAQLVHLGARGPTTQAQAPVGADDDPRWARSMVLHAATGMAGQGFPAREGPGCRTCSARFSCPVQPEGQGR